MSPTLTAVRVSHAPSSSSRPPKRSTPRIHLSLRQLPARSSLVSPRVLSFLLAPSPPAIPKQPRDQRGPAGLVTRPQAAAVIAVEVFVEQHEVAPVRIAGKAFVG